MKKKLISIILSMSMIMGTGTIAFAAEANYDPIFQEEITVTFNNNARSYLSQLRKMGNADSLKTNYMANITNKLDANKVEYDERELETMIDGIVEEGYPLEEITIKNMYFENKISDGEVDNRLLTVSEVNAMRGSNVVNFPDTAIGNRGKLTLTLAVTKKAALNYVAKAEAVWSMMGSNGNLYPAPGDDAIAIAWGGQYYENPTTAIATGTTFNDQSITMNRLPGIMNASIGWSFNGQTPHQTSTAVKKVSCRVNLTKNNAAGEKTSISASYLHTFDDVNWQFSVGAGYDGSTIGVNISVSPANNTKHWSLGVQVCNIPY